MKKFNILFVLLLLFCTLSQTSCNGKVENSYSSSGNVNSENTSNSSVNGSTEQSTQTSSQQEKISDEEYFSTFKPTLRFVASSDAHIGDSGSQKEDERLASLFTETYKYAAKQEYKKLDAAIFSGDCSDNGTLSSMKKFFKIVNDNIKEETKPYAVLGNHEYYTDYKNTASRWLEASGYESEDLHFILGGYHFILISIDKNGNGCSTEKLNWLRKELKIAAEDDPTNEKPIFVFQHKPPYGSVYGSYVCGLVELKSVLSCYPQVFNFSGHSHYPINDPRVIWQGNYTAIGGGTLSYFTMDIAGFKKSSIYTTDEAGGYTTVCTKSRRDAAQYYIVEVDENNAIRVIGYDLISKTIICTYDIRSVADKKQFKYTDSRKETSAVPVFAETDEIIATNLSFTSIKFTIPQATCVDNVQNYRIELYDSMNTKIDAIYRLSDTFFIPTPKELKASFSELSENTEYTIKCYAVSSWEKESEPLIFKFKTKA